MKRLFKNTFTVKRFDNMHTFLIRNMGMDKIWNSLPSETQSSNNPNTFKHKVKKQ